MFVYKGGTRFSYFKPHYSFTDNYLSELGLITPYSGVSNLASRVLFTIAIVLIGTGSIIFYFNSPFLFRNSSKKIHSISKVASYFGIIASLAFVSIGFLPADVFITAHRVSVYVYGLLVLPSLILYIIAIFLDNEYPNTFGWVFASFALVLLVFVLMNVILKYDCPYNQEVAKIITQKIAIIFNAINIIVQAIGSRKQLLLRTLNFEQEKQYAIFYH